MSASLTTLKSLTEWLTTNCGKFLKRCEIPYQLLCFMKTCVQVKNQQLEPDTEQWTGTKLGKEYVKAVYFHSPYLIYMQGSVQFYFIVYTKALTMFVGSQQTVKTSDQLGSVAQSCMTLCNPHGLQHTRIRGQSPIHRATSKSCLSSQ